MSNLQTHINSINFIIKLNYYNWFDSYTPNHFNLINKLYKYKHIYLNYKKKYPEVSSWINLNEELFKKFPSSKEEFYSGKKEQEYLIKQIISDINFICDKNENKKCDICSEKFQNLYIKHDYRISQNINTVIECIKNDIIKS
jgi:hypothetical protein